MIPYGRQTIEEDDIQAVVDVLRSDYLTTGPKIAEFEKMVADYVGAKYAVAISNGTSALHAACFAAGIQPGDEVITVAAGFPTTVSPMIQYGAVPVFVDVTIPQYNIDPSLLEAAWSPKTKAVMLAHTLGNPFDLKAVREFFASIRFPLVGNSLGSICIPPTLLSPAYPAYPSSTSQSASYQYGPVLPSAEVQAVPIQDPKSPSSYGSPSVPARYNVFQILHRTSDTACQSATIHPRQ